MLDSSTNTQDGTQDPIELISSSEDDYTDARLLIVKTSGAADRYLRSTPSKDSWRSRRGQLVRTLGGGECDHRCSRRRPERRRDRRRLRRHGVGPDVQLGTWQEFGYQLREGPTLTAMPGPTQIVLSWTAVEANHWTRLQASPIP